ncbi:MAG: AlwI family type II restriction endonuclease [Ruminococcus sp.]
MPAYKSYCWSLGTTSFRMVEFNRKIELQLKLLNQFWSLPQYKDEQWSANNEIQSAYYDYIKAQGFIEDKTAPRKDKDARQKTSGLVDLGLIDNDRRLTNAGRALLEIAESGKFLRNNILRIPADSFIYFKQLMKSSCPFENDNVRPYMVLAYILSEIGEISKSEFTYLLPLAINKEKTERIVNYIKAIRDKKATIDDVIVSVISEMDNYQEAKKLLIEASTIDDVLIQDIGMNRKSRAYDTPYTKLYYSLRAFNATPNDNTTIDLFNAVDKISGRARLYWKFYLFNSVSRHVLETKGIRIVKSDKAILTIEDEIAFKEEFFKLLHLFKAKSLLDDYYDLNKRYFKTSDTIIFQDDKVRFDIIPKCYFALTKDSLLDMAFSKADNLEINCELSSIGTAFAVTQERLFDKAEELYGIQVRSIIDIQDLVEKERYERLNHMIDTRFTDDVLINLMTMFEKRADSDIQSIVTNNADVPTIFEYVLAIVWYKISGRQGKVLDYMNLSLDADLLPITHAAGGHEDITYHYEKTGNYPAHTLLIEATLANSTNQRRMEMEPVSRHLGEYLLEHSEEAYCVFATTFLHVNVVSDFRARKVMPYYSSDGAKSVDGMKIIPVQTTEIKTIIEKGIKYAQIYKMFEQAYQANTAPNLWYKQEIINRL